MWRARPAAQVQHGRAGGKAAGQDLRLCQRYRVVRVFRGQKLFGHTIVAHFYRLFVRFPQRAVTPPSTTMHAPMQEADSSAAR